MNEKRVILLFVLAAGALVTGTVVAAFVLPHEWDRGGSHHDCGVRSDELRTLARETENINFTQEGGRIRALRTLTYSADAAGAMRVASCVSTGTVRLGVSPDDRAHIEVFIKADGDTSDAARQRAKQLEPVVRASGERLVAHEPARTFTWGSDHASMSVTLLLPARVTATADLNTGTGRVVVEGVRLAGLDASTGTGRIELDPSWAEGSLDASTGTGSIKARFPALGNASLDLSTGTSAIEVAVPGDARHGYHVDAATGTGGIHVQLPSLADEERGYNSFEGATAGFEAKEVQVRIDASTGTGGITITTV